jgi:hypothetical protein
VVLYGQDGEVLSAASYWNADYTPLGPGEVLFLLRSPAGSRAGVTAYSVNRELARFLWSFNQYFGGFEDVPVEAYEESADFRLFREKDSVRLDCASETGAVRVEWNGFASPGLNRSRIADFGREAGRSYDAASVVCPVTHGSISVSGERLPGAVVDDYADLPRSAFLAWCETWVRVEH